MTIAVFGDCADTADSGTSVATALDTYGDVNIMVKLMPVSVAIKPFWHER